MKLIIEINPEYEKVFEEMIFQLNKGSENESSKTS